MTADTDNKATGAPLGTGAPSEQIMERLTALLVKRGHLTADTLEELEHRVKWLNEPIDRIIAKEQIIPEQVLLETLGEISGIPIVSIAETRVDAAAVNAVPARVAARYQVMPLGFEDGKLRLATDRIVDFKEEDHLRILLDRSVVWTLCRTLEISECIKHYYGVAVDTFIEAGLAGENKTGRVGSDGTEEGEENRHVLSFVQKVIEDAIRSDATDIHIEPYEDRTRLRYRIDGVLYPVALPHGVQRYYRAIISSIKVVAQLNIAERRLPQDGGFSLNVDDRSYDLRVSILPARHGESANLRILNRTSVFLSIEQLGMGEEQVAQMKDLISQPYGVVLFTGATGSGKTTSLYASLAWLNNTERKIITIEDPVEYQIEGITQLQVNPQVGFTFASGLRSVLRHDPDVILIGEIRDDETAGIAIGAALTGHMVFSTLHTNDSASSLLRLADMGVETYLLASSVQAVAAQRLVRRICLSCKEEADINAHVVAELAAGNPDLPDRPTFYKGRGCPDCRFTGYAGRRPVYEILVMNDEIRALVVERASSAIIMKRAIAMGLQTLRQSAWLCALEGITTVDDVLRVTRRQ